MAVICTASACCLTYARARLHSRTGFGVTLTMKEKCSPTKSSGDFRATRSSATRAGLISQTNTPSRHSNNPTQHNTTQPTLPPSPIIPYPLATLGPAQPHAYIIFFTTSLPHTQPHNLPRVRLRTRPVRENIADTITVLEARLEQAQLLKKV